MPGHRDQTQIPSLPRFNVENVSNSEVARAQMCRISTVHSLGPGIENTNIYTARRLLLQSNFDTFTRKSFDLNAILYRTRVEYSGFKILFATFSAHTPRCAQHNLSHRILEKLQKNRNVNFKYYQRKNTY